MLINGALALRDDLDVDSAQLKLGKIYQITPSNDPEDFINSPCEIGVGEVLSTTKGYFIQDNAFKVKYGTYVIYVSTLKIELQKNQEIIFGHIVLYKDTVILVPTKNMDLDTPYRCGW
jgi:hypothetical protein